MISLALLTLMSFMPLLASALPRGTARPSQHLSPHGPPICPLSFKYYNTTSGLCQYQCDQGFFPSNQNGHSCLPCHPQCRTCTGKTQYQCSSCRDDGLGLVVIEGQCACPLGMLQQTSEESCLRCEDIFPDCLNCNKTGCLTCQQGHFINQASLRCQPCSEGCIACSSGSACVTCNHRYTKIRGNCLQLPSSNDTSRRMLSSCSTIFPNCMVCDRKCFAINPPKGMGGGCSSHQTNLLYCKQCTTTYYVAADQFSCLPCSSHCYTCTSGSVCTTCLATFTKVTSGSTTTCSCNTAGQYFYDSATGKCKTCTYFKTNCQTCSLSGSTVVCSTCISGYALAGGICQLCPVNCAICAATTLLCTTCISGYALVGGVCQLCPTNCTSCAATTLLCTTCIKPSYTLSSGVCSCDETTGASSTFLAPSGVCLGCSTLQPNCVDCLYDASFSVYCSACSPNYKVDSGSCVCDDTSNYFLDVSANICRTCGDFIYGCATCVFNNVSQMIDCSVPDSSHMLSWSGTQMVCLACYPNCASCSASQTTCDSCLPNFSSSSGTLCDICDLCGSCPDATCVTCNSFPNANQCLSCMPGYYYNNVTSCIACPSGCLLCGSNDPTCLICQDGFMLSGSTCVCNTVLGYFLDTGLGNCEPCSFFASNCKTCFDNAGTIECSTCNDGFYPISPTVCGGCGGHCLTCTSPASCTLCQNTYDNPYGNCICNDVTLFYDSGSDLCQTCNFFDPNCLTCSTPPLSCSLCSLYYYAGSASAPFCTPCPTYCQDCTVSSCTTCDTGYLWSSTYSNCSCDQTNQYFINTTNSPNTCQLCSLSYCLNCSSLGACIECDVGYFIDPATQWCRQTICGDGLVSGSQECDDGGASGGCVDCKTKSGYVATFDSMLVGSCVLSSTYKVVLQSIQVRTDLCNMLALTFQISGFDAYLPLMNFSSAVILPFEFTLNLNSSSLSSNTLRLQYNYFSNYQQKNITFFFLFSSVSPALPDIEVVVLVQADNNIKVMYYTDEECSSRAVAQQVVEYTEYASYGVLLITALPAKIVGLEAIGVLQLAFLTLGSLDGINLMMTPLLGLKDSSGYTFSGIVQHEEVPTRIKGISYDAAFLNNCNLMMAVLGAEIVLALVFFGLAQIVTMYSATLSSIGSRLIKEGLLTLLLFNAFNFSYSAALHLHYSPETQQLRTYSTLLAVAGLGVAVLMCVGITMAGEQGFGQYKDKFKSDCLSKGYLTATLIYRMALGYYMASQNQDQLSTLMVLAFSIGFVLYNLVNLPFSKAYHNYRANLCHLTQFTTLMVATYYRSMKSTAPLNETYSIYQPAYLELGLIVACVGVSALVGLYDLYLFVKEKAQSCSKGEEEKVKSTEGGDGKVQQQSLNTLQAQQFT